VRIIPAIDIQDGCVVRFVQGRHNKKVYSRDPFKTARYWIKSGAKLLHIVDLDGAMDGTPKNLNAVKKIARDSCVPIQFGGGVRSIEIIKKLLNLGVWRVILGTRAIEDEAFLKKSYKQFKDKIIVGVDAQNNNLLINGWQADSRGVNLADFVARLKKIGFKELIYTDTQKDGTLTGPNVRGIKALMNCTRMKIIASGGISCLGDIRKLKTLEKSGLSGIIVGKALYEGRFLLSEALKLA